MARTKGAKTGGLAAREVGRRSKQSMTEVTGGKLQLGAWTRELSVKVARVIAGGATKDREIRIINSALVTGESGAVTFCRRGRPLRLPNAAPAAPCLPADAVINSELRLPFQVEKQSQQDRGLPSSPKSQKDWILFLLLEDQKQTAQLIKPWSSAALLQSTRSKPAE